MIELRNQATQAIFKAYITSEAVIAAEQGINPRSIIAGRLAKIEHLNYTLGALLLINRTLSNNGIPCVDPLCGYKLNKEGNFNNHRAVKWREFYRLATTVGDAWQYVLTVNDLDSSVVNRIFGYDSVFFEGVLSRGLNDLRKFAFYPEVQV